MCIGRQTLVLHRRDRSITRYPLCLQWESLRPVKNPGPASLVTSLAVDKPDLTVSFGYVFQLGALQNREIHQQMTPLPKTKMLVESDSRCGYAKNCGLYQVQHPGPGSDGHAGPGQPDAADGAAAAEVIDLFTMQVYPKYHWRLLYQTGPPFQKNRALMSIYVQTG